MNAKFIHAFISKNRPKSAETEQNDKVDAAWRLELLTKMVRSYSNRAFPLDDLNVGVPRFGKTWKSWKS